MNGQVVDRIFCLINVLAIHFFSFVEQLGCLVYCRNHVASKLQSVEVKQYFVPSVWKTQNAETTRISRNSIIFVNLAMCVILALHTTAILNDVYQLYFWISFTCIEYI